MIQTLEICDFRCFPGLQLDLQAPSLVLEGPNGIGKTSILEALHAVSRLRSFRTPNLGDCIRRGTQEFAVRLHLQDGIQMLLQYRRDRRLIEIDNTVPDRLSTYLQQFPVIAICPEDISLAENPAEPRRRLIDQGIFDHNPDYLAELSEYQQVLRNRNALLKNPDSRILPYLNARMAQLASSIVVQRRTYIEQLQGELQELCSHFDGMNTVEIFYNRQAPATAEAFETQLERSRDDEIRLGHSLHGPHRDPVSLNIQGMNSARFASLGEKRLAAILLKIASYRLLQRNRSRDPVLLFDEPLIGLDQYRFEPLLHLLDIFPQIIFGSALPNLHRQVQRIDIQQALEGNRA